MVAGSVQGLFQLTYSFKWSDCLGCETAGLERETGDIDFDMADLVLRIAGDPRAYPAMVDAVFLLGLIHCCVALV